MTMQQIECFLEAVKCSSFSAAAANLFMSQPTLSRHIIALEQELKVSLFVRANNTIRLTGVGRTLYPKLKEMYAAFLSDSQELHALIRNFSGRLCLGIQEPQSVDDFLKNALNQIKKDRPELNVILKSVELKQSYAQLLSGEIDLLVAIDDTIPLSEQLDSITLYQDQMCICVPVEHPNASLERIYSDEIASLFQELPLKLVDVEEFVAPLRTGLYKLMDDRNIWAAELVRGEEATISSFRLMSETGLSMTFFNQTSTMGKNDRIRLIPMWTRDEQGERPHTVNKQILWLRDSENPLLPRFLELVRDCLPVPPPEPSFPTP